MEKAENIQENESTSTYQDSKIKKSLNEIEDINKQIDLFNKTINNQIKWVIKFYIIVLKNWREHCLWCWSLHQIRHSADQTRNESRACNMEHAIAHNMTQLSVIVKLSHKIDTGAGSIEH